MQLLNVSARAHPAGNRIDLYWEFPRSPAEPRLRLLFDLEPNFANDLENTVISPELKQKFLDHGITLSDSAVVKIDIPANKWQILDGQQRYIVIKNNNTLRVHAELRVRVVRREGMYPTEPNPASAKDGIVVPELANKNYAIDEGLKGEMVYYYTLFPHTGDPPVYDVLDSHNRAAAMATAPYNLTRQMYDLLPAIYHRYDTVLPTDPPPEMPAEDTQKGQLLRFLDLPGLQLDQFYSFARAVLNFYNLDRVDGRLLPLLAQWIGWKTDYRLDIGEQRNEIRFAPHLYKTIGLIPTVEATVKRVSGWESRTKEFVHNVARTNQPERLNLWSMVREGGNWGPPALTSVNWVYEGRPAVVTEVDGSLSFFYQTYRLHGWDIWTKRYIGGQKQPWQPSAPIVDRPGIDKHPTAALQKDQDRLWLFWESYDSEEAAADRKWRIYSQSRSGDTWSSIELFGETTRRLPAAAVDNQERLWLFWLEQDGTTWKVKYNRHNGADWELTTALSLPLDDGQDPPEDSRVEDDLMVVIVNQQIWLFWARHEPIDPSGQTRWNIAFRMKQGLGLNASNWSPVNLLPKNGASASHDREPAPRLAGGGRIGLFWSSNRSGNWSIWTSTLTINGLTWSTPEQITTSDYSERAPLAVDTDGKTLLLYRSNESLDHPSTVYSATHTLDARYAGTTTFDTRNTNKRDLRGKIEDFQTYTYDSGRNRVRTNEDRIARDTVGLYLKPDSDITDPDEIKAIISRLNNVLVEFMPITARAVFIVD